MKETEVSKNKQTLTAKLDNALRLIYNAVDSKARGPRVGRVNVTEALGPTFTSGERIMLTAILKKLSALERGKKSGSLSLYEWHVKPPSFLKAFDEKVFKETGEAVKADQAERRELRKQNKSRLDYIDGASPPATRGAIVTHPPGRYANSVSASPVLDAEQTKIVLKEFTDIAKERDQLRLRVTQLEEQLATSGAASAVLNYIEELKNRSK